MTKSLYQNFFGLSENPFSIIPDPRYLYLGAHHQEALAHLLFGVGESGGFVLLSGEVGTGKTTVCRALSEQLPPHVDLALILNPKLGELELMASICDEMHIAYPEDTDNLKSFFDLLNAHLLEAHSSGRNPVLMIDEAQALPEESIELVRLLTNLETSDKKLLQIILVGQPELNQILAQPHFRQTSQRITARYHLGPLGLVDCKKYIDHRLHVAGIDGSIFTTGAIKYIHKSSNGIPRLINSICDRAMLGAYAGETKKIGVKIASMAAAEVLGRGATPKSSSVWTYGLFVMAIALAGIIFIVDPGGYGFTEKSSVFLNSVFDKSKTPVTAPASAPAPAPASAPGTASAPTPAPALESKPAKNEPLKTDLLNEIEKSGTLQLASAKLFKLWGKDYLSASGTTQCDKATSVGISCMAGSTDIAGLKAINRPALVSFTMPDGEKLYGVITQIQINETINDLTIEFGDHQITMVPNALSLRWNGDYLILWNPPKYYSHPLSVGDQGEDVVKLRQLLARSGYGDALNDINGNGSRFFGSTMRAKVMAFQRAFGLNPDGIIIPETMLILTGSLGAVNGPSIFWEE